jgi:hypothetical protein
MIGQNKERWRELCEQVEVEQDPKKLVELTTQIYRLLEEKRRRLQRKGLKDATAPEILNCPTTKQVPSHLESHPLSGLVPVT